MEDQQPLVPFYQGHASLLSLVPPSVYAVLFAVSSGAVAFVWLRRRNPKSKDTDGPA